ncbi:MAG: BatA domain-containing protein, partial [Bacteroidia bacterium]|nr:BatA domain-containing protein [Bacteroidia bacterium]
MKFVNPSFLFALFAISIPIIIHLFNFRRYKTIYFTNVKFLKEVQLETQSRSKLKHLLVLLARILTLIFLVFAFAQPYLPLDNKKIIAGTQAVSIYVDNSFSMDAIGKGGRLLDEAKRLATEITGAYKPADRFQLLTNDFEGKHQRLVSREEFLQMLDEIKLSPSFKNLQQVLSRQAEALNNSDSENKTSFVISDFQKNSIDTHEIKNDTTIKINLLPLTAEEQNNLYIDSCWFLSPVHKLNQPEELFVRIKNNSGKDYENIPVKLFINNMQKTPASFNIRSGATLDTTLSFTTNETGIQNARIELSDYPVTFDDKFYFSFNVLKQIPILSINAVDKSKPDNANPYLRSLFGKDSVVILSNVDETQVDYSTLNNYRLIILNELKMLSSGLAQELTKFVANGGNLILFPAAQAELNSYKDFLTGINTGYYEEADTINTKVDLINYMADVYKDVFEKKSGSIDLPIVFSHYIISKNSRSSEEVLLKLLNGNSFLSRYVAGKGSVYLFAVPLNSDWSNFTKHALFVPTMYQVALYSQPQYRLFYTIGNNEVIETPAVTLSGQGIFKLTSSDNKFEIIPEQRAGNGKTNIYIHNQIKDPGNYFLNMDKESSMGISFNYNRNESDLSVYTNDELKSIFESKGFSNVNIIESTG